MANNQLRFDGWMTCSLWLFLQYFSTIKLIADMDRVEVCVQWTPICSWKQTDTTAAKYEVTVNIK